jgi:5-formyltetrahydrofolate cyclo-ligase
MKHEIRKTIRAQKKELGKDKLLAMSLPITELIESNKQYQDAPIVMLYHPLWDEVDVRPLFDRALASGKRVILPTVKGDDIIPVEITSDTQWVVGDFDILEPVAEPYQGNIDLIVIPGVAFDLSLNRLGRGKGYYDRFLAHHPNAYRLGVCFKFQMVDEVPTEPFDLPMHELITV